MKLEILHNDSRAATLRRAFELAYGFRVVLRPCFASAPARGDSTRRLLSRNADVTAEREDTKLVGVAIGVGDRSEYMLPVGVCSLDTHRCGVAVHQADVDCIEPDRIVNVQLGFRCIASDRASKRDSRVQILPSKGEVHAAIGGETELAVQPGVLIADEKIARGDCRIGPEGDVCLDRTSCLVPELDGAGCFRRNIWLRDEEACSNDRHADNDRNQALVHTLKLP